VRHFSLNVSTRAQCQSSMLSERQLVNRNLVGNKIRKIYALVASQLEDTVLTALIALMLQPETVSSEASFHISILTAANERNY
jgi:hypothetical protein